MMPPPFNRVPENAQSAGRFGAGSAVFVQGQRARGPYFLEHGEVELWRHTETGQRLRLFRALAGETIAEASLFSTSYHCDCIATADSQLIGFDKSAVLDLIASDHEFSMALLARLAGQVQDYRRRLEIVAIKSAQQRVLVALGEFGQSETVMSFSQQIGLSHEATYRALSQLVKKGLVTKLARGRYLAK